MKLKLNNVNKYSVDHLSKEYEICDEAIYHEDNTYRIEYVIYIVLNPVIAASLRACSFATKVSLFLILSSNLQTSSTRS